MKKDKFPLTSLSICRRLFTFFLFLISFHLSGQTEEQIKAIESIAHYLNNDVSLTDEILTQNPINFEIPKGSVLEAEWASLNAMNKIAIAYKAAENNLPEIGGQRYLALLSKTLAQGHYESAAFEPTLKPYLDLSVEKFEFINFEKNISSTDIVKNIPLKTIEAIGTIVKYTDAGALGGTREVLITHLGLNETQANEMLLKHKTNKLALTEAIKLAPIPPAPKVRLKNIARGLFVDFESATFDPNLINLFSKEEIKRIKILQSESNQRNRSQIKKNAVSIHERKEGMIEYKEYINQSNTNEESGPKTGPGNSKESPHSFKKMKTNKKGFGGIILGNSFSSNIKDKLNFVRWIPYSKASEGIEKRGRLEFVFANIGTLKFSDVLQEDVYAASEIVFGKDIEYVEGNGIGLTGLTYMPYPNGLKRHEIIIHPVLKYLNLGWSIITSDAYPECTQDISDKLKEHNLWNTYKDALLNWEAVKPDGWKITEMPLLITREGDVIEVLDSLNHREFFFTMVGDKDNYQSDVEEFGNILPALMEISPDFNRLKSFTEIITLFRWIKFENAFLVGLNTFHYTNFVDPPNCLIVTSDKRLDFYDLKRDKASIQGAIKSVRDSINSKEYPELIQEVEKAIGEREKVWLKLEKAKLSTNELKKLNLEEKYSKLESFIKENNGSIMNDLIAANDTLNTLIEKLDSLNKDSLIEYRNLLGKLLEEMGEDADAYDALKLRIEEFEQNNSPLFAQYKSQWFLNLLLLGIFQQISTENPLYKLHNLLDYEIKIMEHYSRPE